MKNNGDYIKISKIRLREVSTLNSQQGDGHRNPTHTIVSTDHQVMIEFAFQFKREQAIKTAFLRKEMSCVQYFFKGGSVLALRIRIFSRNFVREVKRDVCK